MTKKEKFLNFLNSESAPDYIPFHPILMHFAARFNGNNYAEFASDHRILVHSNIKALDYFDMDWVQLISDPYRETSAFGAEIEYVPEGVPKCLAPIVKTMEDLQNLKKPDVTKAPRTLDRIEGARLYQEILKGTVPVFGWIEGPLAEACDLVGVGEMLTMLMVDPDFCNQILDKSLVTAKDFAKAQLESGVDVVGIGDAICSQIDADTYNAYVRDRHKDLIHYIHSLGGKVKLHICGNITHLIPSMTDFELDILDIDWQVDFHETISVLGPRVAICGNLNPILIQNNTIEELQNYVKSFIKEFKGKKVIFSGGCEITVNTPVAKLKAISDVLKEF